MALFWGPNTTNKGDKGGCRGKALKHELSCSIVEITQCMLFLALHNTFPGVIMVIADVPVRREIVRPSSGCPSNLHTVGLLRPTLSPTVFRIRCNVT